MRKKRTLHDIWQSTRQPLTSVDPWCASTRTVLAPQSLALQTQPGILVSVPIRTTCWEMSNACFHLFLPLALAGLEDWYSPRLTQWRCPTCCLALTVNQWSCQLAVVHRVECHYPTTSNRARIWTKGWGEGGVDVWSAFKPVKCKKLETHIRGLLTVVI